MISLILLNSFPFKSHAVDHHRPLIRSDLEAKLSGHRKGRTIPSSDQNQRHSSPPYLSFLPLSPSSDTHSSDLSTSTNLDSVGNGLFGLDVGGLASVSHKHLRHGVHGHSRP